MRVYTSSQLDQISRKQTRNAAASAAGGGLFTLAIAATAIYIGSDHLFKAILWLLS